VSDGAATDAAASDGAATDAAAEDVNASADASAGDGSGHDAPADRKRADRTDGSAVAVDERPADAGAPSPSIDPESTEDPESTDLSRERDVVSSGVLVEDAAAQDVAEAVVNDPWVRAPGEKAADDIGDIDDIGSGVSEDDIVAVEVAHQFEAVVGEDSDADPAEFAAAAVLDVLRASGWADIAEATELRAESARLRELLSEVIRDHRAREASMAGVENQQLHWLVPLLRAAHGVAFGSLGAKVALRTAVQDVPPEVLRSAGLRIDYGVTHDYGAEHDYEDDR
jgi:hypothetical protein